MLFRLCINYKLQLGLLSAIWDNIVIQFILHVLLINILGYDKYIKGYDQYINGYDKYFNGYDKCMKDYDQYIKGYDKYMKGYDKQRNDDDKYIKGYYKYITGYDNYIDAYDKYTKDFLEKIFTAMPKKYLWLLCPLYQWSVELARQNGGGGGRLRAIFRQAERNLQSDNINV